MNNGGWLLFSCPACEGNWLDTVGKRMDFCFDIASFRFQISVTFHFECAFLLQVKANVYEFIVVGKSVPLQENTALYDQALK